MIREISATLFKLQENGGMCLVVTLKDKGFLIVDGGVYNEHYVENDKRLMDFLKARSLSEKPEILGWFFTHFHHDHVHFAAKFLKNHTNDIDVKGFYVNAHGGVGDEYDFTMKELLFDAISDYPHALVHTLKTSEKIAFPYCTVDVLLTEADLSPKGRENQNFISAAFNVRFDNGRTFMVLGDCDESKLQRLIKPDDELFRSDEELKCDVLQCAHHGLPLGNHQMLLDSVAFYEKLRPAVCFFATGEERMATDERFKEPMWAGNYYLLNSGAKCYNHSHIVTVNMVDLSVVVRE